MKKVCIYNEEGALVITYEIRPDLVLLVKDFLSLIDRVSRGLDK